MERARSGDLDHEQLGEIRRTLNGMTHDATEGHRLLHAAYERDGALGPIQALDTFSRSHRDSWTSLRDRLPVQLTDVGNQVSSVFDAIDEEVAPLQSLLPRPPEKSAESQRSGSTGTSADPSTGTRTPSPSSSARHEDTDDTDGSSTSPRPSDTGSSPAAWPDRRRHGRPLRPAVPRREQPVEGDPELDAVAGHHHPAAPPGPDRRPGHRRGEREGLTPRHSGAAAAVRRRPTAAAPAACTACAGSAPAPGPSG